MVRAKNKIYLFLVISLLFACQRDNRPPISTSRFLGSECGPNDHVSTNAAKLNTGGGWWGTEDTRADYERTREGTSSFYTGMGGFHTIRGFVKFDKEGTLQARAYADIYDGSSYCGWSPKKINLKPTAKLVFVEFDTCIIGDGGGTKRVIHEVCWIPNGSQVGKIIYSSKYSPSPKKEEVDGGDLSRNDVFEDKDMGGPYYFNQSDVLRVINERLIKRDLNGAEKLLRQSIEHINNLVIEKDTYREALSRLYSRKLGLLLGEPEFATEFQRQSQSNLNTDDYSSEEYRNIYSLFLWLHESFLAYKEKRSIPALPTIEVKKGTTGYDYAWVLAYLRGKITEEEFLSGPATTYLFWAGMHNYLNGNYEKANSLFLTSIEKAHTWSTSDGFELAAAAKLAK